MKKPLKHLAIIPDGNRRWARKHKLNAWLGHKEGTLKLNEIGTAAIEQGVTHLTFWASSIDNLTKRSKTEVHYLLQYMHDVLVDPETFSHIKKYNIQVRVVGRWRDLIDQPDLVRAIEHIEAVSRNHTKRFLTILFGYDGQVEMLAAISKLHAGRGEVTATTLRRSLWTGYLPDVDLVIRTGGEPHWSAGFMMWLTANSQFYFSTKLWPDFGPKQLVEAVRDYEDRERRLGK